MLPKSIGQGLCWRDITRPSATSTSSGSPAARCTGEFPCDTAWQSGQFVPLSISASEQLLLRRWQRQPLVIIAQVWQETCSLLAALASSVTVKKTLSCMEWIEHDVNTRPWTKLKLCSTPVLQAVVPAAAQAKLYFALLQCYSSSFHNVVQRPFWRTPRGRASCANCNINGSSAELAAQAFTRLMTASVKLLVVPVPLRSGVLPSGGSSAIVSSTAFSSLQAAVLLDTDSQAVLRRVQPV